MSFDTYQIRQCENPACGLRYPLTKGHPFGERCPSCLGPTRVELERPLTPDEKFLPESPLLRRKTHLEALLDNVRSAWNVGSIFRTADGFGLEHLYLCGVTPTPEHESVAKTALGAEKSIVWSHHKNALMVVKDLKASGRQLVALEQDERARSLSSIGDLTPVVSPLTVVIGNEVSGVDPALLDLCDCVFYIPMYGEKRSLNVEVAFGVLVSWLVLNA